ncbi:hydroxyacid dehydrogenase [Microbacterium sp. GXF0217]
MTRLKVVLAMRDTALADQLMTSDARERLAAFADLSWRVLCDPLDASFGAELAEADALLTGWGAPAVDHALLERAPGLRAVAHAAGSLKRIVTPAAWERGIRFSTAAAENGLPVAEYTLSMILLSGKRVFDASEHVRAHRTLTWTPSSAFGNAGAVVGIVGASRIGRRVLELLEPFDLTVLLSDPTVSELDAAALGATLLPLDQLLRRSSVVSLHAPLLPETTGLIGSRELALMPDGATLVNTARGAIVDTDALVAELTAGRLRAILDVTDPEPLPQNHALYTTPGTILTPHVAGALGNELTRLGAHAVAELERFAATGSFADEVLSASLAAIA